ncbi:hypothetical protein AMECASPLE_024473 [Ameca splendens]|uniref:Uncharacterized protein n=1 Tax=Ameca splendens TaxID=208324 RepID=A0ABV0ZP85_9TELE
MTQLRPIFNPPNPYLKSPDFEKIMPCTLTRFPGGLKEAGPQHHRSSTVLNSRYEVLLQTFILCFTANPPEVIVAEKLNLSLISPIGVTVDVFVMVGQHRVFCACFPNNKQYALICFCMWLTCEGHVFLSFLF